MTKTFAVLCTFAMVCAAATVSDQPETKFSVAKKTRIPGAELKEGTYTLRVVDHLPDRYILEVSDEKHSAPLTTFLAIPDESLPKRTNGTPIYWSNSGHVPAIRGMWFTGAKTGAGFVFPKNDAAALAKEVGIPVPAVDPDSEGKKSVEKMNESDRQIVTLWLLSAVAITPGGKETGIQAAKFVHSPQSRIAGAKSESPAQEPVAPAPAPKPYVTASAAPAPALSAAPTPPRPASPARAAMAKAEPAPPAAMPRTAGNFATSLLTGLLCLGAGLFARSYLKPVR